MLSTPRRSPCSAPVQNQGLFGRPHRSSRPAPIRTANGEPGPGAFVSPVFAMRCTSGRSQASCAIINSGINRVTCGAATLVPFIVTTDPLRVPAASRFPRTGDSSPTADTSGLRMGDVPSDVARPPAPEYSLTALSLRRYAPTTIACVPVANAVIVLSLRTGLEPLVILLQSPGKIECACNSRLQAEIAALTTDSQMACRRAEPRHRLSWLPPCFCSSISHVPDGAVSEGIARSAVWGHSKEYLRSLPDCSVVFREKSELA